jgi:hypothetical protein
VRKKIRLREEGFMIREGYKLTRKFFEILRNKETARFKLNIMSLNKNSKFYTTESLILAQDER